MRERIPFRCIGVEEAASIVGEGRAVLLDVRDANSYAASHVEGARNLAYSALSDVIGATPKSQPVVIYCYHGNASREYAQTLSDFGFAQVFSVDGGYEAWRTFESARAPAATLDAALSNWLVSLGFPADGVNVTAENGMTPLMKASQEGLADVVGGLIAAGAVLDARNGDGNTALWLACVGNHPHVIDALVDAGITIDSLNDTGASSLMYAASAGKVEAVEKLLARGADPRLETQDGFCALDLAANLECLKLLRAATRREAASA
ncbi:ankyrin repeat domain-containing protein [Xanthobacter oligotrophicus]|uniref:ankyrin repeat domain-containing protein n=1 Tax=Xanthobacter oligotrophicus TaxID=2607286 RepID=UPI0011F1282F|nr:ankyrin repeat domain-containing protein [Xanthobacter oligotrophicus]MCG5235230.1 ankyrin repeat domain-containing protein [Xanthobacter oligotrophicus]